MSAHFTKALVVGSWAVFAVICVVGLLALSACSRNDGMGDVWKGVCQTERTGKC
jgi:hypothetical protein